ncbi:hypothetical protein R5R73_17125 [Salinicola sp. LHM]|uniref:hypothetical protein n=1 Tax=Salinicola sp. LHM TaxID=3065298 RepID=UPI002ACDDFFB|nr:hypothetical protein [Salinicola sp. LHM]WQH32719.1 hypothetical protein R5R73_17125 [Salinicola sp. LHM]
MPFAPFRVRQNERKPATLLRERRVLISATGPYGNVLKIRPPLVFAREHVDRLSDALAASLAGWATPR